MGVWVTGGSKIPWVFCGISLLSRCPMVVSKMLKFPLPENKCATNTPAKFHIPFENFTFPKRKGSSSSPINFFSGASY